MMRAGQLRILQRCIKSLDGISANIQAHGLSRPLAAANGTSPGWASLHSLGVPTATLSPAGHAYHGSGSDDDELRGSELQSIHDILRRHAPGRGPSSMAASQHLHEGEARRVMRDPLAMLMMSRGVPLGISLKVQQDQQEQQQEEGNETEDEESLQAHRPQASTSGDEHGSGAAVSSSNREQSSQSRVSRLMRTATGLVSDGRELSRLMATANGDSWDITQESAAEIAQRIADSNRASRRGGSGDGAGDDGNVSDDEDDLMLPPEEDQKSFESVQADLKTMDEIFEILAQVPWLDDGVDEERELRGVATTGLLGTLEEVGWQLRPRVERIWAGERDSEAIIADMPEREQAALVSILFHTSQLEEKFGPPPPAAAGGRNAQQGQSA